MKQKEEKDRFSVDMTPAHHEMLAALAKQHKITQGEIIECLLDARAAAVDLHSQSDATFNQLAIQKRQAKVAAREQSRVLYKEFKAQQKSAVA